MRLSRTRRSSQKTASPLIVYSWYPARNVRVRYQDRGTSHWWQPHQSISSILASMFLWCQHVRQVSWTEWLGTTAAGHPSAVRCPIHQQTTSALVINHTERTRKGAGALCPGTGGHFASSSLLLWAEQVGAGAIYSVRVIHLWFEDHRWITRTIDKPLYQLPTKRKAFI
jgi:hypothetical protein